MQISARNKFKGRIKKVEHGAVNSEVTVELPGGVEILSMMTKDSGAIQLSEGKEVYTVITASDVIIGLD